MRGYSPITIFLSAEHFQRPDNNVNAMAEELANAILSHEPFRVDSIGFEIRPVIGGDMTQRGDVIYVRT